MKKFIQNLYKIYPIIYGIFIKSQKFKERDNLKSLWFISRLLSQTQSNVLWHISSCVYQNLFQNWDTSKFPLAYASNFPKGWKMLSNWGMIQFTTCKCEFSSAGDCSCVWYTTTWCFPSRNIYFIFHFNISINLFLLWLRLHQNHHVELTQIIPFL